MSNGCGFCRKMLEKIDHVNKDRLDIYLCVGCQSPNYETRFRQVCFKNESEVLAETIKFDEFYIIRNYSFNYTNKRTNYTQIYRNIIGALDRSLDLSPMNLIGNPLVYDFDSIIELPFDDLDRLKSKLLTIVTFS
jgi:hypothetical protein